MDNTNAYPTIDAGTPMPQLFAGSKKEMKDALAALKLLGDDVGSDDGDGLGDDNEMAGGLTIASCRSWVTGGATASAMR